MNRAAPFIVAAMLLGSFPACGTAWAQEPVLRVIAMPEPRVGADTSESQGLLVDGALLEDFRRLKDRALQAGAEVIVFEITTPGGMLQVAEQFIHEIRGLRESHGVRTAAYIPDHATSAGAMLALACGELLMAPNATIGNVIPLEFKDLVTLREAGPKVKTKVVTTMRSLSQDSGWPELLLEGMADQEMDIVALKDRAGGGVRVMTLSQLESRHPGGRPAGTTVKHIAPPGRAVELTTQDAGYLGLPVKVITSRTAIPGALGVASRPLGSEELLQIPRRSSPGFFSDFGAGSILATVLLMAGIAFVILELKTPGLGVFGVLALLSFIGYFLLSTDSSNTVALTTACLILGFFLILAEILIIPGFGVAGISGLALVLLSLYVAGVDLQGETLMDKVVPDTPQEWADTRTWLAQLLGSLLIGVGAAMFVARNLHLVPFLNKTLLNPPVLQTGGGPTAGAAPGAATQAGMVSIAVGTVGTADTDLRPAGRARFKQGLVDVVSDGEWIRRGTRVQVLRVEGNRVVVASFGEPA